MTTFDRYEFRADLTYTRNVDYVTSLAFADINNATLTELSERGGIDGVSSSTGLDGKTIIFKKQEGFAQGDDNAWTDFADDSTSSRLIPGEAEDRDDSSPIRNERIFPGLHRFEIKKKGYAPLSYDLLVNPAQAVELDFFLNPIYECKFKTDEKGLVFELNGEHRWDVDLVRLRLEAGDHLLRVFKIGEIIDEQIINVDQPKKYNYFLKKPLSASN